MTDLECGNCEYFASDVSDTSWYDGHSWCTVTVYCENCKAETVYEFVEPMKQEVYTIDE